jgi:drug/metabolite transporter (DMT)-like permease
MLLKDWKAGGSLDTTLAMVGGVVSFAMASMVARKLAKDLPDSPFSAQLLTGGSLAVATFLFSKHVFGPESEIPASLFTGTSSAYLAKYTESFYE